MISYKIGTLIKTLRKERGVTAEELAFNAGCDVTTLSRIENNKFEPSARVFEAIMVKLGFDPRAEFEIWSMAHDYKSYRAIKELNDLLCQKRYKEAEEYKNDLEKEKSFSKGLNRQFLLSATVSIMTANHEDPAKIIPLVIEALSITINPFNEKHIDQYYLSYDEITLINILGIEYYEYNEHERAIEILYKLKASMDRSFIDESEKARTYPVILYNLTKFLGLAGQHEEVLKLCQIAKDISIRQNKLQILPKILCNYAYALYYIGNKEDSKKYAKQAYELYTATDRYMEANHLREHINANLGFDL